MFLIFPSGNQTIYNMDLELDLKNEKQESFFVKWFILIGSPHVFTNFFHKIIIIILLNNQLYLNQKILNTGFVKTCHELDNNRVTSLEQLSVAELSGEYARLKVYENNP